MADKILSSENNTIDNLFNRMNKSKNARKEFMSNINKKIKCNGLVADLEACIPLDLANRILENMKSTDINLILLIFL
jgi:hypothetical protein